MRSPRRFGRFREVLGVPVDIHGVVEFIRASDLDFRTNLWLARPLFDSPPIRSPFEPAVLIVRVRGNTGDPRGLFPN
jgi:hypothetical protein